VSVVGPDGREFARGICAYSDATWRASSGGARARSSSLLGFRGRDEMIHRDDLAILRAHGAYAGRGGGANRLYREPP
jgi:glutamate 5-kinase